jgi:hypothetical protein
VRRQRIVEKELEKRRLDQEKELRATEAETQRILEEKVQAAREAALMAAEEERSRVASSTTQVTTAMSVGL